MNPLHLAIERYEELIDHLAQEANRHLVALGDPELEGVRIYTFSSIKSNFNYDEATELGAAVVDGIEEYLIQVDGAYSLLHPILSKLVSVAPRFNTNGFTVILGSWGMAPSEIGWMIRKINNREIFDRYLQSSGVSEASVDAYNESYQQELEEAEQAAP
jgi:hypothetical protein